MATAFRQMAVRLVRAENPDASGTVIEALADIEEEDFMRAAGHQWEVDHPKPKEEDKPKADAAAPEGEADPFMDPKINPLFKEDTNADPMMDEKQNPLFTGSTS